MRERDSGPERTREDPDFSRDGWALWGARKSDPGLHEYVQTRRPTFRSEHDSNRSCFNFGFRFLDGRRFRVQLNRDEGEVVGEIAALTEFIDGDAQGFDDRVGVV